MMYQSLHQNHVCHGWYGMDFHPSDCSQITHYQVARSGVEDAPISSRFSLLYGWSCIFCKGARIQRWRKMYHEQWRQHSVHWLDNSLRRGDILVRSHATVICGNQSQVGGFKIVGIFIKVVVAVVAITFVVLGGITVSVRSFGGVVFFLATHG